jgi:hypothetical protein
MKTYAHGLATRMERCRSGRPESRRLAGSVMLDSACPRCDNRGLEVQPIHQNGPPHVLAVCLRCSHAEELHHELHP